MKEKLFKAVMQSGGPRLQEYLLSTKPGWEMFSKKQKEEELRRRANTASVNQLKS